MRLNTAHSVPKVYTNEGAPAKRISPEQALRRSVLSCLLWEKEFYEDGTSIADRITENAAQVSKEIVASLAVEARTVHGLRHAPLMLLLDLIRRGGPGVAEAIDGTLRRADELGDERQRHRCLRRAVRGVAGRRRRSTQPGVERARWPQPFASARRKGASRSPLR